MSSLPLISHRLFVAAIGSEDRVPAKPDRNENAFSPAASVASAISLELLHQATSMPSNVMRPLAVAAEPAST